MDQLRIWLARNLLLNLEEAYAKYLAKCVDRILAISMIALVRRRGVAKVRAFPHGCLPMDFTNHVSLLDNGVWRPRARGLKVWDFRLTMLKSDDFAKMEAIS